MSTAISGDDSMASKCLAFCQTLSIGSDFTFSLDTRSKASESQRKKKSLNNQEKCQAKSGIHGEEAENPSISDVQ